MANNSDFADDRTIAKADVSIDILANGTFIEGYKINRLIGQGGLVLFIVLMTAFLIVK